MLPTGKAVHYVLSGERYDSNVYTHITFSNKLYANSIPSKKNVIKYV